METKKSEHELKERLLAQYQQEEPRRFVWFDGFVE